MVQRLLIEGKHDIYVVSEICQKHLPLPRGFTKESFRDFIIPADGISRLLSLIPVVLKTSRLTNFGIIVDADEDYNSRFQEVTNQLQKAGFSPQTYSREKNGVTFETEGVRVGIWVMPDNDRTGYLEHFVANLIPAGDQLIDRARGIVQELLDGEFARFRLTDQEKAVLHTWLAWQKKPGLPMGTAIKANLLDVDSDSANAFISWVKATFQF